MNLERAMTERNLAATLAEEAREDLVSEAVWTLAWLRAQRLLAEIAPRLERAKGELEAARRALPDPEAEARELQRAYNALRWSADKTATEILAENPRWEEDKAEARSAWREAEQRLEAARGKVKVAEEKAVHLARVEAELEKIERPNAVNLEAVLAELHPPE